MNKVDRYFSEQKCNNFEVELGNLWRIGTVADWDRRGASFLHIELIWMVTLTEGICSFSELENINLFRRYCEKNLLSAEN